MMMRMVVIMIVMMVVIVIVLMVVIMSVAGIVSVAVLVWVRRGAQPLVGHPESYGYDGEPRNRAQPFRDLFRHHESEEKQCSQTERKYAHRMSKCDHRAQKGRVLQRTARSNQICGDDCFSVAWR